ncbi:MAG: rhomboid family intramembrane serine protease [FCB group bacterium]|jgi:rhomboid protease GluP|nr:rhomboid family intramembrane serine protease [FCB group bacterium]
MQLSPKILEILAKLGVNTTRLQWKLYQRERRQQEQTTASRVPTGLRWLEYQHKFCPRCNAVVAREDRICPKCGRHVPSMGVYRIRRLLGLMSPGNTAVTVYLFLFAIMVIYLLQILKQGPSALISPNRITLLVFGGWNPYSILLGHEYWRMLSFGIVHAGILHILFNGLALTQVGPTIEEETGPGRMLTIITLTQLAAAIGSHVWYINIQQNPHATTVGASGWLFGLIGYGIGHYYRSGERTRRDFFVQWAIYGLLFGLLFPGINNAAHVGGMVGGMLLGAVPSPLRRHERFWNPVWTAGFWISAALWLITLGFMARYMIMYWSVGR